MAAYPSSPESAASTTGSPKRDGGTSRSANPTSGGEPSSPHGSPECRSTRTFVRSTRPHGPHLTALDDERWEQSGLHRTLSPHSATAKVLISSAAGSPAKTYPSPDDEPDSTEHAPASSTNTPASPTLFDPAGYSSRTYPVSSLARAVGTSEQSLERWPTSGTAWHGGFSTAVSSECRSDGEGCSSSEPSLTEILEEPQSVPGKYSLSARAAQGILRRAERRGRTLPEHLAAALTAVGGESERTRRL